MSQPTLLLGRSDVVAVLQANQGTEDDGLPYTIVIHTNRTAPAGIGGECVFTNLYLTVRHFLDDVTLAVTAIVDGTRLPTQQITLTGGADEGTSRELECSLMVPYLVGGVERLRYAPRGCWIEVEIDTIAGNLAAVDIGAVEVEYEVVRETKSPSFHTVTGP